MDRDTFEQFKNTLQNQLNELIAPRMRTDGGFASGGFDAPPPISPAKARVGFEDLLASLGNPVNAWSLDKVAAEQLIDVADGIYIGIYAKWLKLPLAGDAPAGVVAWWKAGQAGGAA